MTFSSKIKQEILSNKPMRVRHKLAYAYGLFLFSSAFGPGQVSLRTETPEIFRQFEWCARELLGRDTPVLLEKGERSRGSLRASLPEAADRKRLLSAFHTEGDGRIQTDNLSGPEDVGAFLAGAYLACGNMTDPEKGYHLEFVVRQPALADSLQALLNEALPGAGRSERRKHWIVYYKECGLIEDLLTWMGAPKCCLEVIDVEAVKSVRNRANREVNCETANIDKLVGAAAAQVESIRYLIRAKGEEGLPEPLQLVARLRLENPDASLRELATLSPEPLSRSGIHHRLDKLTKMAEEVRLELEGGERHGE